jgi:NADP-dependent 3-hydroxy acid dehydrogenase YdfG
MVQPQDCADLILYVALLPKRLVMNEVMLSPTWNRGYVAALERLSSL